MEIIKFFTVSEDIPYMNQVVEVREQYKDIIPSVTHIDGTARIQTVYENHIMHTLLTEFEKLSGVPILLNTSFNIKDKTMVLFPVDAINTFKETEIDILIMENYFIYK